jgi:hypothetical protein
MYVAGSAPFMSIAYLSQLERVHTRSSYRHMNHIVPCLAAHHTIYACEKHTLIRISLYILSPSFSTIICIMYYN